MADYNVGPVLRRSMPFWCVGNPLGDPFGSAVLAKIDSLQTADILCRAADQGWIEATGFHDDDLVAWDPERPEDDCDPGSETSRRLAAIKQKLDAAGLQSNTATCNLHANPLFRRGGLTNPDPAIRELARLKVARTVRIGHYFGAQYYTYWVARDGFEVGLATPWEQVFEWIAEGLNGVETMIREQGYHNYIGGTVEPKPNEPRGHMFLPTSGHAAGFILGKLKQPAFWGVNPELLQHESMTLLNALNTLTFLISVGKLSFLHFGSQIKGQFDNDFPPLVGPEGLKESVQMFWLLKKLGWKGVVEFDCHMLRTEADPADPIGCRLAFVRNCCSALTIALQLAERLDGDWMKGMSDTQTDLAGILRLCALDISAVDRAMVRS